MAAQAGAGALSGSALTAGGVWNLVSSTRPWPSGVRIMAMSARTSLSPTTWPTQEPSTCVSPSNSIPSSAKNDLAASRSSTTMRTCPSVGVSYPLHDLRSSFLFESQLEEERRRRFEILNRDTDVVESL